MRNILEQRGEAMLLKLFEECLQTEYRETDAGGSWAYRKAGAELFIWFEHSHGIQDWISNLQFGAIPYREMSPEWKCHAGFLRVWKSLKPYITELIADPSIKAVRIVGYSHGAALAVLCHEYIWYHRPDLRANLFGYGFGCPRVLFGCVPPELAIRWDHFFVIRNIDDIVTHLPPRSLGFCHVGNLVTIGKVGKYSPIDAHRPESYLAELSE